MSRPTTWLCAFVSFFFLAGCGAKDNGEDFDFGQGFGGTGLDGGISGFGGGGSGGIGAGGSGGIGAGGSGGIGAGGSGGIGAGGSGGIGAGGSGGIGAGGSGGIGAGGSGGIGAGGSGGIGAGGSGGIGAGGSGASGGIGATGGADGGILEDCTNKADDDGDGFVDCEDFDCSAFACAPTAPAGWQGPFALVTNNPTAGCDEDFPATMAVGLNGLNTPPVKCAGCGCAPPLGTVCPLATLRFSTQSMCSPTGGAFTIPANVCQPFILTMSTADSVLWDTAPPAGGACSPMLNGQNVIPPLNWAQNARACAALQYGGGCGSGVCAPKPSPPFGAGLCIQKLGDNACPASPFNKKSVYFTGVQDNRTCTDCLCSAPSGGECSGTVVLGTNQSCTADVVTIPQTGVCAALPNDPTPPPPPYMESRSARFDAGIAFGGSCSPSGGTASGAVTPVNPITFCCL